MGTSDILQVYAIELKDHPHAYGDKVLVLLHHQSAEGSSPRVWGQDLYSLVDGQTYRIIPTRMGTRPSLFTPLKSSKDHPHAYGDK